MNEKEIKEEWNNLLNKKIDYLSLKVRTYNSLYKGGISTLGQIISGKDYDLLKLKGFGIKCFKEIYNMLEKNHLKFGMTYNDYLLINYPEYCREVKVKEINENMLRQLEIYIKDINNIYSIEKCPHCGEELR